MSTQAPNQERCGCQRHECVVHTVARSEAHEGLLRGWKSSEAAFHLGNHYLVAKDARKAIWWYQRAATAGHTGAQYNLGLMYLKGKGLPRDAVEGLGWITKAADNGDEKARALLQRIDEALVAK